MCAQDLDWQHSSSMFRHVHCLPAPLCPPLCRRLVRAYNQSAATLNLLRGFSTGGYAGLDRIAQWNLDFMTNSDEGKAYMDLVGGFACLGVICWGLGGVRDLGF